MQASNSPNIKTQLLELFRHAAAQVAPELSDPSIILERPKQVEHGDYACNLAMQLAKPLRRNPREIATALIAALPDSPLLEKTEIAGAGFINLFLKAGIKQLVVADILTSGTDYGRCNLGNSKKIQVEFVSANPTGPLHVGHGRGAAYGASLANLLAVAGYSVSREYYVNDAGRQMDILALSTWLRYLEVNGADIAFPPNAYQGDYVVEMARQITASEGGRYIRPFADVVKGAPAVADEPEAYLDCLIENAKQLLGDDYSTIHNFALTEQLRDGAADLQEFGVEFDEWFSEKSLFDSGLVARAIGQLEDNGFLYVENGAKWFRSTQFGDEKDRVVQRENGQFTYFASDIAYHMNKFERGFDQVIDIWGADHHGYVPRVKGALTALGLDAEKLVVALVQFAVLYRDGKKASMSTRSGEFVTLRELRKDVGNDAARFFYVLRKSDQHLDFDLDLAKSQTNDNPVYYIQYAHARVCSVLAQWGGDATTLRHVDASALSGPHELALLQQLTDYCEVIENAARDLAPHTIAFYLKELAGNFHSYYNAEQFLVADDALKKARLALICAVRQVLANGLQILGVSAPEKM